MTMAGSVKSVFNQAAVYSTSLNNADGECDIAGIVTYEKTGESSGHTSKREFSQ